MKRNVSVVCVCSAVRQPATSVASGIPYLINVQHIDRSEIYTYIYRVFHDFRA